MILDQKAVSDMLLTLTVMLISLLLAEWALLGCELTELFSVLPIALHLPLVYALHHDHMNQLVCQNA